MPPRKPKTMSKEDIAAELGLDDTIEKQVVTTDDVGKVEDVLGTATANKEAVKTREAVKVGAISTVKFSSIPGITRKGGSTKGETKYNFESLAAPEATGDAESPWNYDARVIEYDASEDEVRFSRSIQTAYTKANADAKEAKSAAHYIGRKYYAEDGKLAGMYVFRVDGTLGTDAE